jgi:hypothetical protein
MAERNGRRRRPDRVGEALRGLAAGRHRRVERSTEVGDEAGARLAALEREVQEVRTRVNALFFAVLTAAAVDLIGRAVLA